MKAAMYHYVRRADHRFPKFRYLSIEDFRVQLDWLQERYTFPSRERFLSCVASGEPIPDAMVLTFDDSFSDHLEYVLPELQARSLWGVFYVPTLPYTEGRLLDVHMGHLLLGRVGGTVLLDGLLKIAEPDAIENMEREDFHRLPYRLQDNDADTAMFKRMVNYFLRYEVRGQILEELAREFLPDAPNAEEFYVSREGLAHMARSGMLLGSHGHTHRLMSRLELADQRAEIEDSFAVLEGLAGRGPVRTFCHPYGGDHSFNADTVRLLEAAGVSFSFSVEGADIVPDDLRRRPHALPRYDCNQFPHGQASGG